MDVDLEDPDQPEASWRTLGQLAFSALLPSQDKMKTGTMRTSSWGEGQDPKVRKETGELMLLLVTLWVEPLSCIC